MKKLGLSAFVMVAFIVYSFYVHARGIDALPVLERKTVEADKQVSVTPTIAAIPSSTPTRVSRTSTTVNQNQPTSTPAPIADTPASAPPPQQPVPTDVPASQPAPTSPPPASSGYKDGSYTGSVADAFYGNVQVQATIQGGNITGVQFLQYPNDRQNSIAINSQAMPFLQQEAIQAQSAQVNIVSGATATSQAFIASLGSALAQAK